ncbi:DNA repair protein [Paraglaciecola hydrolytica]|uniref:DNA repair protein n=2 Tax=Paraglaciecola hydrolytica TaxID=1799789 RepID=A0A136A5R5_9ALTE|nr:DNA repair protein [Paraglaciecola hydrolytica]
MQQDLFTHGDDQLETCIRLAMPDADVCYYPDFLSADQAQHYFNVIQDSLLWHQEQISLYGKTFQMPRLQAWYGDKEARYSYSNLNLTPNVWTAELLSLKQRCEQQCAAVFNSVLANLYRDGQDSMGKHADDEAELGQQPVIASLSLGATRTLLFSHKETKQSMKLPLAAGSLLVMKGTTQQFWLHAIAKRKTAVAGRINLTFRYIYPDI